MAKYIANPNPYSQTLSGRFSRKIFLIITILLALWLAYWLSQNTNIYSTLFALAVVTIAMLFFFPVFIQVGKNDRGKEAEEKIKRTLLELSDAYTIFQNVPVRKRLDVDFLVLGPKNIFAVEVKSHAGIGFLRKKQFIDQTFAEAMAIKKYLRKFVVNVFVNPVLVFTRAKVSYEARPNGVCTTTSEWLLTCIAQAKTTEYDKTRTEDLINKLYKNKPRP